MPRPACGNQYTVRPRRFMIGKKDRNFNVCIFIAGIQYADGLMAHQLRLGPMAPARYIAFRDCPTSASDSLFYHTLNLINYSVFSLSGFQNPVLLLPQGDAE